MRPRYATVCFDVDSTLVTIEGIDVLARGSDDVVRLTEAAMSGEIPLDEVYGRRLEIVRPGLQDVESLGRQYVRTLTPGAAELVRRLLGDGVVVRLVTAGIEQAVLPLASALGIPDRFVHAVPLRFDGSGRYAGYDESAPTARQGGKQIVIRNIRARNKGRIAFVGDGVTDLETEPVVDAFIGFGGVVSRPSVRTRATRFVDSFDQLVPLLYEDTDD